MREPADMSAEAVWARLVALTRSSTLILGQPRLTETPAGVRVETASSRVAWGFGLGVVAAAVLVPINWMFLADVFGGAPMSTPWWIVVPLMALLDLLVVAAIGRMITHRASLELDAARKLLRIDKGRLLQRSLEISLGDIRVEWGQREPGKLPVVWPIGDALVSLRHARFPEPVHIAGGQAASLEELHAQLARWLPADEKVERFVAPVALHDGRVIRVSTLRLGEMSSGMPSHTLRIDPPFIARLTASTTLRLIFGGVLAIGLFALGLALDGAQRWPSGALIPAIVGAAFAAVGFVGVAGGMPETIIDLDHDLFEHRVFWRRRFAGRARDVVALQLCAGWEEHSDSAPSFVYELNAVLSEPPGQRFMLMAGSGDATLRHEAERLARFLGVDVLDHTA